MTAPSIILEMIEKLIAIDTSTGQSNLAAISLLRDHLAPLGAVFRQTFDESGRKANLYATLGPTDRPGIMLSGHTDTVPVAGQNWRTPPFRLTKKDGKLYGRGIADMKGFIGLAAALAPEFIARGLTTPLHFAFSYDEEIGCIGARSLIADLAYAPCLPRLCLVGEPTEMQVVAGHKSVRSVKCHVRGQEAHSATNQGVNAIEAAARLIVHIAERQMDMKQNGPFDPAYDPPMTTLHTGAIQGGGALNIVPNDCVFHYQMRGLPSENMEFLDQEIREYAFSVIEPSMKEKDEKAGFSFEIISDLAGFDLAEDHEAVRLAQKLSDSKTIGRVSFMTEAGLFAKAGVPTAICGPGSIAQAHKPDEFMTLEQLSLGERYLGRLMDEVCKRRV